jgi:hypothetical protein
MGQQQILLIVLSVILVGIAIAVGITMFSSQAEQNHVDMIIADLNNLSAVAYQYYLRPLSMGGGGNSFTDFDLYFNSLGGWDSATSTGGFSGIQNDQAVYFVGENFDSDSVVIVGESKVHKSVSISLLDLISPPLYAVVGPPEVTSDYVLKFAKIDSNGVISIHDSMPF